MVGARGSGRDRLRPSGRIGQVQREDVWSMTVTVITKHVSTVEEDDKKRHYPRDAELRHR